MSYTHTHKHVHTQHTFIHIRESPCRIITIYEEPGHPLKHRATKPPSRIQSLQTHLRESQSQSELESASRAGITARSGKSPESGQVAPSSLALFAYKACVGAKRELEDARTQGSHCLVCFCDFLRLAVPKRYAKKLSTFATFACWLLGCLVARLLGCPGVCAMQSQLTDPYGSRKSKCTSLP